MKHTLCRLSLIVPLMLAAAGCQSQSTFHEAFSGAVERAHHAKTYHRGQAIAADVVYTWGGDYRFRGTMVYEIDSTRARLIDDRGRTIVHDGKAVFAAPADKATAEARMLALGMPYMTAVPFHLSDEDVLLTDGGKKPLFGVPMRTAELHQLDKQGELTPDHVLLYLNPNSYHLAALGNIITRPGQQKPLGADALVYSDYVQVSGVSIASKWAFYRWEAGRGPYGGVLGQAKLTNIRFIAPAKGVFTPPADAVQIESVESE